MTFVASKRHLLLGGLLLAGVGLAAGYAGVQSRLARTDVLDLVEAKARQLLRADVQIGKVRYVPPTGMSLQDVRVNVNRESLSFSVASIDRLVFGYGLLNFIRRDFSIPTSFRLDSPKIRFLPGRKPLPLLESAFSSSPAKAMLAKLIIREGEFHYPLQGDREWVLSKVHLQAQPDARGRIRIRLTSQMEGIARGELEVRGWTDVQFHHYELKVAMKNVTLAPEGRIPLRQLDGRFSITEKTIQINGFTSLFHDWEIKGDGRIDDWQTKPKVSFEINRKKGTPPFRLELKMDFESEKLGGRWSWADQTYSFDGKVRSEGKKVLFSELVFPEGYTGKAEWDRSNGDYVLWLEREKRRFQIHSNLSRLDFETDFKLDHASINHLDWVVSGKARFTPLPQRAGEKSPRFKGQIRTDYLIVEYEPFEDFNGTCELGSEGIQGIDFRWGKVFRLGGGLLVRGKGMREDLVLRVEGLPLATVRDLGGRPLPSNLSGILEGKLKFRGDSSHPEIQGYFTIKDGTIEKLDFDLAIIQFQGYPPYLRIYDSKILKGRNTLKLTGAINLKLPNIFRGIQIRGPDHLVIWKGMSVYWKKGRSAVEAEKPVGKKLAMGLEVGSGVSDATGEDPEESHAMLGPKLQF